jgi:hypothetical protein
VNINSLSEWFKLPDQTKKNIFDQVSNKIGLPATAIEKDWWVVHTLKLIYSLKYQNQLVFKGGTSLSKAWNLIKRFSEDVDLVLNREFLGFPGELSRSQVKKLRETSCHFICDDFLNDLKSIFDNNGFTGIAFNAINRQSDDTDPIQIEVTYQTLFAPNPYLLSRVLIEIGSRSLMDPFTVRSFSSFVGEVFKDNPFADLPISIPVVNPERTLLEKILLLHEEFQKEPGKIKVEHMSRHHYDIIQLYNSEYVGKALNDSQLFKTIVDHRQQINFLNYVDYSNHQFGKLNIIPPDKIIDTWEKDYNDMKESMIYGDKPTFNKLMTEISEINSAINQTS